MGVVMRVISRIWATAVVLLAVSLTVGGAEAALQGRAVPTNGDPISIELNEGQLLRLDRSMSSVFIANPTIADVTAKSERLLYLYGKMVGTTTLFALDANDNVIANVTVTVSHSLARLQQGLNDLLPDGQITASSVDGAIVLESKCSFTRRISNQVHVEHFSRNNQRRRS
jgi:pilus assembly protein CpaC